MLPTLHPTMDASSSPLADASAEIKQKIITHVMEDAQRESETKHPELTPGQHKRAAQRAMANLQMVSRDFESQVEGMLIVRPELSEEYTTPALAHLLDLVGRENVLAAAWNRLKGLAGKRGELEEAIIGLLEKRQHFGLDFSFLSSAQNRVAINALQALSQNSGKNDLDSVRISFIGNRNRWDSGLPDIVKTDDANKVLSCLAPLSANNRDLKISLDLRVSFWEDILDKRLDVLSKAFKDGANVTHLDASDNHILLRLTTDGWVADIKPMKKLFAALAFSKNLVYLDLSHNHLDAIDSGFTAKQRQELALELGDSLGDLPNLKTLRLCDNGGGHDRYEGLSLISGVLLKKTTSLTNLDISFNHIRNGADLAKIVKEAPACLEELDVSDNDCAFRDEDPILKVLPAFTSLKSLNLGGRISQNPLAGEFISGLITILPDLKQMSRLGLDGTPLNTESVQRLASCVTELPNLTELAICIPRADNASEQALARAQTEKPGLQLQIRKI